MVGHTYLFPARGRKLSTNGLTAILRSKSHLPFPRKGTETLARLQRRLRSCLRSHLPFPRKGTETFDRCTCVAKALLSLVTPTFSPQGDGNSNPAPYFARVSACHTYLFPARGRKPGLLLLAHARTASSHTYLFPARGRKPGRMRNPDRRSVSHTYLFPARGRKHKVMLACVAHHDQSHLPFPRKGTETDRYQQLHQLLLESHLPFPRKGTETDHHDKPFPATSRSHLPFPRKGTETFVRRFTEMPPGVLRSHLPFPRKGTET